MMLAIHFVPTDGSLGPADAPLPWPSAAAVALTEIVWDKCASLFCVAAGLAWSLLDAPWGVTWRRAAALAVLGVALFTTVWPTEILSPLSLMMLLLHPLRRGGLPVLGLAFVGTLVRQPVVCGWLRLAVPATAEGDLGFPEVDWLEDGSHRASLSMGWVTLRYYLIDGSYPLLPWFGFVLAGAVLATVDWRSRRVAWRLVVAGVPAAIGAHAYRVWADRAWYDGGLEDHWVATWDPVTSLPFFAVGLTSALAILGVLLLMQARARERVHRRSGRPWACLGISALGRLSLTHYVTHIVLVFWPLTWRWPAEDWPEGVGAIAWLGYSTFALVISPWWLRRARRGPIEGLWARLAGR